LRKDVGLPDEVFDHLDRNKDGKLDTSELSRFAERDADVELVVRLGKREKNESLLTIARPLKGAPLAGSVTQRGPGEVVLRLGNARIAFRFGDGTLADDFIESMTRHYREQFRAADRDGNGFLDAKEAGMSPFFAPIFERLDRDGNGKLT